jgi:hypothetical protein
VNGCEWLLPSLRLVLQLLLLLLPLPLPPPLMLLIVAPVPARTTVYSTKVISVGTGDRQTRT